MDLKDWQKIEEEKQVIRKMRKMYMFKRTDGKMKRLKIPERKGN